MRCKSYLWHLSSLGEFNSLQQHREKKKMLELRVIRWVQQAPCVSVILSSRNESNWQACLGHFSENIPDFLTCPASLSWVSPAGGSLCCGTSPCPKAAVSGVRRSHSHVSVNSDGFPFGSQLRHSAWRCSEVWIWGWHNWEEGDEGWVSHRGDRLRAAVKMQSV